MTDQEFIFLRKGRNAAGVGPSRLARGIYGEATALETLLGFLYLTDRERLQNLLDSLVRLGDESGHLDGDEKPLNWKTHTSVGEESIAGEESVECLE
jgi:hypothetical protein